MTGLNASRKHQLVKVCLFERRKMYTATAIMVSRGVDPAWKDFFRDLRNASYAGARVLIPLPKDLRIRTMGKRALVVSPDRETIEGDVMAWGTSMEKLPETVRKDIANGGVPLPESGKQIITNTAYWVYLINSYPQTLSRGKYVSNANGADLLTLVGRGVQVEASEPHNSRWAHRPPF